MEQFSIIIPTINEADNIRLLLQQISGVFRSCDMIPEILVIDDGSTDGTRQLVADYHGDLDVRLICRDSSRGLAGAVVAGALEASHEHIVVMDADLSHPPEMIPALIEPLLSGTHDMVIGSRYVAGGSTPDWPVIRQLGSQLASIPARMLTSTRDPLSGFFSVSREHLKNRQQDMPGFKIGLEILAEKNGSLKVLEVPISFRDRFCGSSKMNFSVLKEYFYQLIRLSGTHRFIRMMPMFLLLGLITGLLDYAFFTFLIEQGLPLGSSHMLSLLGAVHICYPLSLLFHWKKQRNSLAGDYFRFLTAVLLGLFIRGGVLAFPVLSNGTPPNLLPVILVATAFCIWMGAIITVRLEVLRLQSMNWTTFGTLLIGYTILLRLIFLGNIELIQEEAYYWNYSQHMAAGYLDHPPVVALLIRIGTELFGNNEFGVRFGTFICWFITTFFTYKLTKTIFNGDTAFRAVILVASLPIFFGVGLLSTPDAPLIACWSGALYFFYRALVLQESRSWYWAGISLGIGLASKYTIVFLGPAVILYMLADSSARKWFLRPQPYIAAFLALAIFSPVIWWNYENHWASFLFQSQGRVQDVFRFSTHLLLLSVLILLTPTGFLSAIASMIPRFAVKGNPTLANEGKYLNGYFFCLTMALAPMSIFILFSFTKEIKLNWTGPIWLAIIPFIAYSMVWGKGRLQQRVAGLWPGTFIVIMITYGALLHYCAFGLPSTSFAKNVFLYGWDDLARQVDVLAHSSSKTLLVVGMDKYRIASGLAFYRKKTNCLGQKRADINETTGNQLFGNNALMYNYWCPPEQALSRDILVIAEDRKRLDPANFTHHYSKLGKIQEINIKKRGKSAGHFFYRTITSYTTNAHSGITGLAMPSISLTNKMHDS